ncbi:hypothetical protein [Yersinia bercovieri]|uniref:hypothetical protein n=1 Tax=Yersinia bercovieri TaxID=634 RepID=UPI00119CDE0D|nr:hypothetical protein [Yersinia bercovieri]
MCITMTVENLITRLQQYSPEELCVASLWLAEDFQAVAQGKELSREEIDGAMNWIDSEHDANVGINWSVIEDVVLTLLQDR